MSIVQEKSTLSFQLKGGLYPLTVLQLLNDQMATFESQLIQKISQAPKFFHQAPIVLDLQKLNEKHTVDFKQLAKVLSQQQLIPVGIKGGTPAQQAAATAVGLAILQENTKEPVASKEDKKPMNPTPSKQILEANDSQSERGTASRLIAQPVRSGQQIYVRGGDLIVLSSASQGSELLADGHIHVYGPLRGRALAGVSGDTTTHIFCQSLEAELISIAGQYKISEDIAPEAWQRPADISLKNGELHIQSF